MSKDQGSGNGKGNCGSKSQNGTCRKDPSKPCQCGNKNGGKTK